MPPAEDPFDAWRKRHMRDFPDFFADFEKEFARMQGMINKVMEDAMKHASSPQKHEPFVYGFSMRIGKDGVPQIQPFGNSVSAPFKPHVEGELGTEVREPLVDVVEGEKEVAVTAELPGVDKQDVNLHVAEDAVTIRVEKGRRYYKQVRLTTPVVPGSAKATFKNGILDVTILRKPGRDAAGQRVSIE